MDAQQERVLHWMKIGRRALQGTALEECDGLIKEVEDWVAAGKAGLPPSVGPGTTPHEPLSHELEGLKCKRCGIEEIYWKHFPDCSRFKSGA